jgi:DNA repair protein RecN (Recombination protein N)
MIEKLLIRNYLIIKDAEIIFSNGFNILTGETGAGKSIILDALALILGERADYSIIRRDADKLVVEGHFEFKKDDAPLDLLNELLPEDCINGTSVIVRRELLKKGTGRSFINDYPVNIADLKRFGDLAIDIHSQNEHQSLLSRDTHIKILDYFAGESELVKEYSEKYHELTSLIKEYEELISRKDEFIRRRSFVEFELKEINNLSLISGEDEELENELKKMENIEVISEAVNTSLAILYEDESNILSGIDKAVKELRRVSNYDNIFEKIIEELSNCEVLIKESATTLLSYRDSIDFDSGRINEVRERLSSISRITKKYGITVDQLIEKGKELERELNLADNFDFETEKLLNKVRSKYSETLELAARLDKVRKKSAKDLEKRVNEILTETGLESAEMKVNIEEIELAEENEFSQNSGKKNFRLGPKGYNGVEFLIKINKGSEFTPLRKTASGGEISRVMLAIKTVLAGNDEVGILVFDEIDAGISGRVAQKVGKIMKKLSESRQIICITHLPQIAAMSDTHFRVTKFEKSGETFADIKILTENEKIMEVAKLISGEKVTESANRSAKELISGV